MMLLLGVSSDLTSKEPRFQRRIQVEATCTSRPLRRWEATIIDDEDGGSPLELSKMRVIDFLRPQRDTS